MNLLELKLLATSILGPQSTSWVIKYEYEYEVTTPLYNLDSGIEVELHSATRYATEEEANLAAENLIGPLKVMLEPVVSTREQELARAVLDLLEFVNDIQEVYKSNERPWAGISFALGKLYKSFNLT